MGLYVGFIVLMMVMINVVFFEYGSKIGVNVILFEGWLYFIFQLLIVDFFGFWVMFVVGFFFWCCNCMKLKQFVYIDEVNCIFLFIGVILVIGFFVEGWCIVVIDDFWVFWFLVGFVFVVVLDFVMSDDIMCYVYCFIWWFYMVVLFVFIVYVFYIKMVYVIIVLFNIFMVNFDGYGVSLKQIDFEKVECFGVNLLIDFIWCDMFDFDVCIECGCCMVVCLVNMVGKVLLLCDIIFDLQKLMYDSEDQLFKLVMLKNGEGEDVFSEEVVIILVIDENMVVLLEVFFFVYDLCSLYGSLFGVY